MHGQKLRLQPACPEPLGTVSLNLEWKLKYAIRKRKFMSTTRFSSFLSLPTANTAQESLDFLRAAEFLRFAIRANPAYMNAVIDHAHIHARSTVDTQFFSNADLAIFPIESIGWASLDAQSAINSAAGSAIDLHGSLVKDLLDSNRLEQLIPLFSIHSLTIHVQGHWQIRNGS